MNLRNNIKLVLEDGAEFHGISFGFEKSVSGEVVFNTAMTGYPESLTDPSYRGQILVLTYPLIGNYGVPDDVKDQNLVKYFESDRLHISGLIVLDYSVEYSHWNANRSLGDWLKTSEIPGIFGIDTRHLTKILREKGTMLGKIIYNNEDVKLYDPNKENLVAQVSINHKETYGNGKHRVILIDCGVKYNIIRDLLQRDITVIRVPWDYNFLDEGYDGLFISNGPGDPKQCTITINHLREAFKKDIPIMGICLGNQLMALASGADTYKLKYGHVNTNKAYITSQNHGYAIKNDSIQEGWEPYFINLNDQTNEGMRHISKPFFSTQFHPEASGGPTDTEFLFDQFMELIERYRN